MNTPLYTTEEIRQLESLSLQKGISETTLMETAGAASFEVIRANYPLIKTMIVCCGPGNNGGDGYVVARLAQEWGIDVCLYYLSDPAQLTGAAKEAADKYSKDIKAYQEKTKFVADVLVDALFGTGLQREVNGLFKQCIDNMNQSQIPIVALDVPSGLNADCGKVYGTAIKAQHTVTFIGEKRGLYTGIAANYCGKIHCHDLHISTDVFEQCPAKAEHLEWNKDNPYLAPRDKASHKGQYGHTLVIGGDYGMAGAARLCAEAAARVGSGLTSVATHIEHIAANVAARPEIMCHGLHEPEALRALIKKATVLAIGPGLGQSDWSNALFKIAMAAELPMVVDADGLNLLAHHPLQRDRWILTPHPGEAARLLQGSVADVQNDRFGAASAIQDQYGGICVLKGVGTVIALPGESFAISNYGNPGMASGGMGDVLTGVLAGLLAQGIPLQEAAKLGVVVHGLAADKAALQGERGLLAQDLMAHMRSLVNPHE